MGESMAASRKAGAEERRAQILGQLAGVPSLSPAATQVISLVQDPAVEIEDVQRAIQHDASLTADILRMANSSAFGGRATIASVDQAVIRFGLEWVYRFVLASAVGPIASRPVKGYDLGPEALWWHSVAVAAGTEALSAVLERESSPRAFTSGLLHDLGKSILGSFLEIDATDLVAMAEAEGIPFDAAERTVLGIDHAEVGAILLERWNLPEGIVEAVRHHHRPEDREGEDPEGTVELVHVADALCMQTGLGLGRDGLAYSCSDQVWTRLGVTGDLAEQVIIGIQERVVELKKFFVPQE